MWHCSQQEQIQTSNHTALSNLNIKSPTFLFFSLLFPILAFFLKPSTQLFNCYFMVLKFIIAVGKCIQNQRHCNVFLFKGISKPVVVSVIQLAKILLDCALVHVFVIETHYWCNFYAVDSSSRGMKGVCWLGIMKLISVVCIICGMNCVCAV